MRVSALLNSVFYFLFSTAPFFPYFPLSQSSATSGGTILTEFKHQMRSGEMLAYLSVNRLLNGRNSTRGPTE